AIALGAKLIEVHIAFSKEMFGPDTTASLTTQEFAQMVEGIRFTEKMLASPTVKDDSAATLEPLRKMFGQSLVAATDLPAGTILTRENLSCRKPGHGISAANVETMFGKKLKHAVKAAQFLSADDLA
ncbi:MAG TPA: SAF domain-containing protein, partial [Prosthecobacter sp.]